MSVTPGTRCEGYSGGGPGHKKCRRMATVMVVALKAKPGVDGREKDILWPMCAACADFPREGSQVMSKTIEQLTSDLVRSGINPDGYGERIGETREEHVARILSTVPPGTRCECRDPECPTKVFPLAGIGNDTHGERILGGGCIADAVAMVTISRTRRVVDATSGHGTDVDVEEDVPMCWPCTKFHSKPATP